jgi:hypothetical protein
LYQFGYDTGKGPSGQSFREETRLPDGTVKGQYGYLDAQNRMRIVKYTAGLNGFQIDSDSALNDQQLAASRPSQPVQQQAPQHQPQPQQPQPQAPAAPSPYYQPQSYGKPPAYQGLASAASSQPASIAQYVQPSAYQPSAYAPQQPAAAPQQSYSGYPAAPQYSAAPSYTANPSGAYQPNQLTPNQLQQQAALAARSRQAALARQQQQEALIRQQQQAATDVILAQQRAGAAAHAAAEQQQQQQNQPQYNSQYNSQYQPQYQPQYNPSAFSSPVTANTAAAATAAHQPAQAAPAQSYGPRHASTELKPDLLSNFIQLPGVKLIQLDRKPAARPASAYSPSSLPSGSFGLNAGSSTAPAAKPEDEYQGPVVINAALLSYNIGANQQAQAANAQKKA